jgi:phage shock protein PspC (stress-responsive transcriptional regulator)
MTIFDVDGGFWIGMAILAAVTVAYILVCWLIPPKKQEEQKQNIN